MTVTVTTCEVPGRRIVKVDGRAVAWIDREGSHVFQVRDRQHGWQPIGRPFRTLGAAVAFVSE